LYDELRTEVPCDTALILLPSRATQVHNGHSYDTLSPRVIIHDGEYNTLMQSDFILLLYEQIKSNTKR